MIKFFQTALTICILFIGAVNFLFAEEVGAVAPLNIVADEMEFSQKNGKAVFNGNVNVSQGELKVSTDVLEVFYDINNKNDDDEVKNVASKIIASGGVEVIHGKNVVTGESATYNPVSGEVILTGNVVMVRDGNVLKGESLIYNTINGSVNLGSASSKDRIKAVFSF